jgi:hypothetical protein
MYQGDMAMAKNVAVRTIPTSFCNIDRMIWSPSCNGYVWVIVLAKMPHPTRVIERASDFPSASLRA